MSMIHLRRHPLPIGDEQPITSHHIDVSWGGWFNTATARFWPSSTQDDTTRVWLTPSGRWVKTETEWSSYITADEARAWLFAHGHTDAIREHLDVEHDSRGRPEIGPEVKVRLPEHVVAAVDEMARQAGISRAAQLRGIVMDTVDQPRTVDLPELTRRLGLPEHEQQAVLAWTGDEPAE